MDSTHRLFLQVLAQAIGDHKDIPELDHQFISAYEQACLWVEANGYGECTDIGARLKANPWDVFIDSADITSQTAEAFENGKRVMLGFIEANGLAEAYKLCDAAPYAIEAKERETCAICGRGKHVFRHRYPENGPSFHKFQAACNGTGRKP